MSQRTEFALQKIAARQMSRLYVNVSCILRAKRGRFRLKKKSRVWKVCLTYSLKVCYEANIYISIYLLMYVSKFLSIPSTPKVSAHVCLSAVLKAVFIIKYIIVYFILSMIILFVLNK